MAFCVIAFLASSSLVEAKILTVEPKMRVKTGLVEREERDREW